MRKSRYTDEQIIGFLKRAQAGMAVAQISRKGGFSDATFYKWCARFGGMEASDARRLRELATGSQRVSGQNELLQRHRCAQASCSCQPLTLAHHPTSFNVDMFADAKRFKRAMGV